MKRFFLYNIILVASMFAILSCEDGEDGRPGTNANRYDELTRYGKFTFTFSGKMPDGSALLDTVVFPYLHSPVFSSTSTHNGNQYFYMGRTETVSDLANAVPPNAFITTMQPGGKNTLESTSLSLNTQLTTASRQHLLYVADGSGKLSIPNTAIQDFSYDAATGKLKFKFNITVPADKNPTQNPLNISGVVDAVVYEIY